MKTCRLKPGNFRVNQLLVIACGINKCFYEGIQVRGVFLTEIREILGQRLCLLVNLQQYIE